MTQRSLCDEQPRPLSVPSAWTPQVQNPQEHSALGPELLDNVGDIFGHGASYRLLGVTQGKHGSQGGGGSSRDQPLKMGA